jgi:hypothetical protein
MDAFQDLLNQAVRDIPEIILENLISKKLKKQRLISECRRVTNYFRTKAHERRELAFDFRWYGPVAGSVWPNNPPFVRSANH